MSKYSLSAILAGLALLLLAPLSRAEVDGEELLAMMDSDDGREVAEFFVDDVWQRADFLQNR